MIGRASSMLIARAPFLWPVLRRPTQRFWQRVAGSWDANRRPGSAAPLLAACDRLDAPPKRILELGTGTGLGALALAERFPTAEIVGVDLAPAMIEQARRKAPADGRVEFVVADVASLPFPDAGFDLVCQLNLPLFAKPAARMLAPGGHVVVASSRGPATPYYTPDAVLRRRFAALGLEVLPGGTAGDGTYFLARRPR